MIYDTLTAAVSAQTPKDSSRIYKIVSGNTTRFVIATSPAQAALATFATDAISLVTQRERYDATRQALAETLAKHNAAVDAKAKAKT